MLQMKGHIDPESEEQLRKLRKEHAATSARSARVLAVLRRTNDREQRIVQATAESLGLSDTEGHYIRRL
jgi:hypothetical protein